MFFDRGFNVFGQHELFKRLKITVMRRHLTNDDYFTKASSMNLLDVAGAVFKEFNYCCDQNTLQKVFITSIWQLMIIRFEKGGITRSIMTVKNQGDFERKV